MTLKIYSDCISQPSRALVLFCRVAKIPHEYHQLRIGNGDLRTDEMAQINPFKTVRIIILFTIPDCKNCYWNLWSPFTIGKNYALK